MSSEKEKKESSMIKTGFILMTIGGVCALILSYVQDFTSPIIADNKSKKEIEAIKTIFPETEKIEKRNDSVTEVKDYNGNLLGWMIKVKSKGYGGDLLLLVGLDKDQKVAGIQILEMKETPGLGTKVNEVKKGEREPAFLSQFKSKDIRNGEFGKDNIDKITGATISSKAVLEGVKKSYEILSATVNMSEKN